MKDKRNDTGAAHSSEAAEVSDTQMDPVPDAASTGDGPRAVSLVPVDRVRVVNPRSRNRKKFQQIVENICRLGLKKPITVALSKGADPDDPSYDLVCGQGRLEAFKSLGEERIPAIVVAVPREDQLVMSLVENIARRRPTTFEQVKSIAAMRERGYEVGEIAKKVDLTTTYVHGILKLWACGEELLLASVERGRIPVSVAILIADTEDQEMQRVLTEEYTKGNLKGKKLMLAKHLWEIRRDQGKSLRSPRRRRDRASAEDLALSYQQEVERQRMFVKKAKLCEHRLEFVVSALRTLLSDDNFVTLLRAEQLDSFPRSLSDQLGTLP